MADKFDFFFQRKKNEQNISFPQNQLRCFFSHNRPILFQFFDAGQFVMDELGKKN